MSGPFVRVRVLVVDDSATIRRLVADGLAADPDIEVVGTAANGKIALNKIAQLNPDIVTLDVEMPEMDGLETLAEIRKTHKLLPVVMFSSLTERAAATTLEALQRGATDVFAKPSGQGSLPAAMRVIREEMAPRLKALVGRSRPSQPSPPPFVRGPSVPPGPFRAEILAIGASTGGPNALADVFAGLRGPLPVPCVITQHMPPVFTKLFAQRLDTTTPHRVREAVDGDVLEPGVVLVAPGDYHMVVKRELTKTVVRLNQEPPENWCRPAVDPMLRSVAAAYGPTAVAVILTGMGQDGLRGCEHIRAAGGQVIAQDEATSVVWGMPGFVARANLAHAVVPLGAVAAQIEKRLGPQRASPAPEMRHVAGRT